MAEKVIQREVTSTKVKFAVMQVNEGIAEVMNLEAELVGNVDKEKAAKILSKEHGSSVTVLEVEANTQRYQMPVSAFIGLAEIVTEKETQEA